MRKERRSDMETVKISGYDNGYTINITVNTNDAKLIEWNIDNIQGKIFYMIVESVFFWNDIECKHWTTDKKIEDGIWVENIIWTGQPSIDAFDYTCTVLFPDGTKKYTTLDWENDGTFRAIPHQEIDEEIFYQFYNGLPPMTLPLDYRIFQDYPNAEWGFMDSEPYGVSKNYKTTYSAFLKTRDGKYYFLGNLEKDLEDYGSI